MYVAKNLNKSPVGIDTKLTIIKVENAIVISVKCDKEFASNSSKTIHTKNYHEQQKHPCTLCKFKANYLIRHAITVHEGLKYSCSICGFKASRKLLKCLR